jgi:hypothetical protein
MAVPWTKIIGWAPQILSLSQQLLTRSKLMRPGENLVRAADSADLAARVAALEENELRQPNSSTVWRRSRLTCRRR